MTALKDDGEKREKDKARQRYRAQKAVRFARISENPSENVPKPGLTAPIEKSNAIYPQRENEPLFFQCGKQNITFFQTFFGQPKQAAAHDNAWAAAFCRKIKRHVCRCRFGRLLVAGGGSVGGRALSVSVGGRPRVVAWLRFR